MILCHSHGPFLPGHVVNYLSQAICILVCILLLFTEQNAKQFEVMIFKKKSDSQIEKVVFISEYVHIYTYLYLYMNM